MTSVWQLSDVILTTQDLWMFFDFKTKICKLDYLKLLSLLFLLLFLHSFQLKQY
jgi:hypothetical protein